jgi:hypothetical protein
MNYTVITNEKLLIDFINWLPELQDNECYYLCLFARSKYAKNEDGSNKFPHIKTDKSQLKRFIAYKKEYIIDKIRHLEVKLGAYKTKDGADVPQEALALYINVSPRDQYGAMFILMRKLIDIQESSGKNFNIHAEALSAIQKSGKKKKFFDFDLYGEGMELKVSQSLDYTKINKECLNFLKTRGGMHIIVELSKIAPEFKNTWYKYMTSNFEVDIKGDNMIPVPGTYQGGFTPHFIEL